MECDMNDEKRCPDCDVLPGKFHLVGCDMELCSECGWQLISCDCKGEPRLKWGGEQSTVTACRKWGWYAKLMPQQGFVKCDPDDDGAVEDINRLYREAGWDKNTQQWVRKWDQK